MTDNTQPEALRLADALEYCDASVARQAINELRRQHARIEKLEAELEAVGAGGVQELSAAPEAFLKSVIALCSHRGYSPANIETWDKDDKWIADLWRQAEAMLAASPTPPAEKQAEESRVKLLAECRDAFPIPEPSSPLEVQWAAAMARPEEVPEYVRLCVAAMQAAPKAAPGGVSDTQHSQFLSDVLTAAGLITHGKQCKALGERLADMVMRLRTAPQQEAQEPGEIPESIERMATGRYKVVPSHESMFHRWAVVAGSGTQQLYLGSEVECQNMARKFAGAFLDGAFVTMQSTSPNPAPAPLSDDVVRDAAFEAVRKKLCALPRYSFLFCHNGLVQRVQDRTGDWIEFDKAHALFDPVSVDAALAAQGGKNA